MNSLAATYPMPTRNLRQRKPRKQPVASTTTNATTSTSRKSKTAAHPTKILAPLPSPATAHIPKPMRPLTAYHIFFQIEREYIIQTTPGADADKTMHDAKSYLVDVPRRYRCVKLLPDWYAGPGKRRKRKHRKSHGKIGFLELSRVISKRWATLDCADPETKRYVSAIAARELGGYKVEMVEYKVLCDAAEAQAAADASKSGAPASSSTPPSKVQRVVSDASAYASAMISPSSSPSPPPMQYCLPVSEPSAPELVLSLDRFFAPTAMEQKDEIDYSICSRTKNGNYVPSPSAAHIDCETGSFCDPLFELDTELDSYFQQQKQQQRMAVANDKRCVSPIASGVNVDAFDPNFLQMLSR